MHKEGKTSNVIQARDELDALLTKLFLQDRNPMSDPDFTTALMHRLGRQRRRRRFLLSLATLLGLILASSALSALPSLFKTTLQELSALTSGWFLMPSGMDLSQLNGVLAVLTAAVAVTVFSRLLED